MDNLANQMMNERTKQSLEDSLYPVIPVLSDEQLQALVGDLFRHLRLRLVGKPSLVLFINVTEELYHEFGVDGVHQFLMSQGTIRDS